MSIKYLFLNSFNLWMVVGSGNINGTRFDMKTGFHSKKSEATDELFSLMNQAVAITKKKEPIFSHYPLA